MDAFVVQPLADTLKNLVQYIDISYQILYGPKILPKDVTLVMFKKIPLLLIASIFLWSCQTSEQYEKALDPLEGGRNFIENLQQGDIKKAHFYMLSDPENEAYFKKMSDNYFSLDKEGRQQLRQASIQINELSAVDSTISIINYQTSQDPKVHKLKVIQTPEGWKVDLKYSYGPNL